MTKRNLIKVNLPATMEEYLRGNGEGVFVSVDDITFERYNSGSTGDVYAGIMDNDSLYYRGLIHGIEVPVEMRGEENRPVVPYVWLSDKYENIINYLRELDIEFYTTSKVTEKMSNSEEFENSIQSISNYFSFGGFGELGEDEIKQNDNNLKNKNGVVVGLYDTSEGKILLQMKISTTEKSKAIIKFLSELEEDNDNE